MIVAGIDVGESAAGWVIVGKKCGGKAKSALAVGAGVLVYVGHEFGQRDLGGGKRFETGLERRHEHGSGDAFAGYVGNGEDDAVVVARFAGAREDVIVISRDRVGWAGGVGDCQSGDLRRSA